MTTTNPPSQLEYPVISSKEFPLQEQSAPSLNLASTSGKFSRPQQQQHHQTSTESSTKTPKFFQLQHISHTTLSSSFIDYTACPRNNGISGGRFQGSQHPDFQVGLEVNSKTGKHAPASSQPSSSLDFHMVANLGNGTTGGIGDHSWQAFYAAYSMDTNNDANTPSPSQSSGTVEQLATDVMTSAMAQLAATDGPHRDQSANFHDHSYQYQPDPSTELVRGQQSISLMGDPLALANTARADCSVIHYDSSTQSQSISIPEWRRTLQIEDPGYNQMEIFAKYIEPRGLALSSDMGTSDNYPVVQGSVIVKVPVNFLRCESMKYHLPQQLAKIQTDLVNREAEVRRLHILNVGFVWKHRDGTYVVVRLGQYNWHQILNTVREDDFRYFACMWQNHLNRTPAEGPEFAEVCLICMNQYPEYPADPAVRESS